MAGASLLSLLDDITSLLDDVGAMSKIAMKKTAGVLGDDLALNAEQVTGVRANRELPVVWAVAKGSLKNKAILVPAALLISAFIPWAIMPLLMIGGCFLCYEGAHKVLHSLLHKKHADPVHSEARLQKLADPKVDLVQMEKSKIRGAVRTDFILSAEIIVLSLGELEARDAQFGVQIGALIAVAFLITVGVYGLVAAIVKLDDLGIYLQKGSSDSAGTSLKRGLGNLILKAAPWLMRILSVAGTIAMFLVGGGIIEHTIHPLHDAIHHAELAVAETSHVLAWFVPIFADGGVGLLAGLLLVGVITVGSKLLFTKQTSAENQHKEVSDQA